MVAKRARIDLPRRRAPAPRARCRVLAGSSSSCHPWSATYSGLVGFGLQSVRPQRRRMNEAVADRRTLAPTRAHPRHAGARSWSRALRRARRRPAGRRADGRRPGRARRPSRAGRRPSSSCSRATAGMRRQRSGSAGPSSPTGIRAMLAADGEDAARIRGGAAAPRPRPRRGQGGPTVRRGLAGRRRGGVHRRRGAATCWWRPPAGR